jgi:cell division protein YceG involved in septum cleavage
MYYVLTEARAHTFSVTLEEHNTATAICRERNLGCG